MEKRFYRRTNFTADVLVNSSQVCQGSNLSEDGMYIFTDQPFDLESPVSVEFIIGSVKFISKAVVKSVHASGVGLNFLGLNGSEREYIGNYVEEKAKAA
jgi:PilZ domain